ncbi:hypothetical protein GEN90_20095 [Vibrio parahaemolyticus]|nr:hypothetical protein [Vibrio parahaemolyticus]
MLNCRLRKTDGKREQEDKSKELSCPSPNARLSGEQRYHDTKLLHRKHKIQIKPKPPSVVNPP